MFRQAYESILNELGEMPQFLERTLVGVRQEMLTRQPMDDKSPLLEHLWHVRDCESDLYGLRIDRILAEERPRLPGVNVDAWPTERGYMSRPGDLALVEFAGLRNDLIDKLKDLDEPSLLRCGVHFQGMEMNVLHVVEQLARHDRDHRWRIAAILRSFSERIGVDPHATDS